MSLDSVVTIDTTKPGEVQYNFAPCNRLWLPKNVVLAGKVVANQMEDTVLGIRVQDTSGAMHPWSMQDGYVNTVSGAVTRIFVTIIAKGVANSVYLCTGTDVGVGYGNSDGLSPEVGGSSATGDSLRGGVNWHFNHQNPSGGQRF